MGRHGQGLHGKLLSRLLWPTGILFVSTLWIVFSTILWSSESMNEVAATRQQERLTAALNRRVLTWRNNAIDLLDTVPSLIGDNRATRQKWVDRLWYPLRAYDWLILISEDERITKSLSDSDLEPLAPALLARIDAAVATTSSHSQGSVERSDRPDGIVAIGSDLYALNVVTIVNEGRRDVPPSTLVALRRFSRDDIATISRVQGLTDLSVVRIGEVRTPHSVAIPDLAGQPALAVTWTPERPGDAVRSRVVPLAAAGFFIAVMLFAAVTFYLSRLARDLSESQRRSNELAGRDTLSGLASRSRFSETLDAELVRLDQDGAGLAVLFIDLDRFKDVNDTYGHQAGDVLIQQVATRLAAALGAGDTLARFGGDEFAIIQVGVDAVAQAERLARRILDALGTGFWITDSAHVTIGASLGIALAPVNGRDRETLMRLADTALYQAKSEGRNRFSFFHRRMDETIRMRKVVEDDLRSAIATNELQLHYQPIMSADGQRIVAAEALVRWLHPARGMISPAEFIPIAEERGLIIPLSEWVLRQACRDGARWPGLRIAVNVSAIQFRHRDFVDSVVRVLAETNFDASRLELELTEGVVVDDADAAETAIMDLRALGIHLALDDFGTGYSSLIYLRRFAFDTIKIDRSFLESMEATGESAILVHSIVHLGRALGLTVTAEGVETPEQHRFLQALGCHQLQGYLFSKPVPADAIDVLLAARSDARVVASAA